MTLRQQKPWCLSLVLGEVLSRRLFIEERNDEEQRQQRLEGQGSGEENRTPHLCDFLSMCFKAAPDKAHGQAEETGYISMQSSHTVLVSWLPSSTLQFPLTIY